MLRKLLRRLGILAGQDRRDVLFALAFAHGALKDACFYEHGVDGIAGRRVLDMIERELAKHGEAFVSYIVSPDVPAT